MTKGVWKHKCWGIVFYHVPAREEDGKLIGGGWSDRKYAPSEPVRALVFNTRSLARNWCALKNKAWKERERGDLLTTWRVRPVRVVETVKVHHD